MAKFLDTQGVSAELSQTIKNAKERLVIISPYIQVNPQIQRLLVHTDADVLVVCRRERIREEEKWLEYLTSVKVCYHQDLHAKCYLNEEQAILTSMNLYQFSQQNNVEMGLLIRAREDRELYEEIRKEADRIEKGSDKVILQVAKPKPAPAVKARPAPKPAPSKPAPTSGIPKTGFCIRCKTTVPPNPGKPYCTCCYHYWNRYKNDEYEEKYCHICGNENSSTMAKPLCLSCYRTYKDILVTDDIDDLPF